MMHDERFPLPIANFDAWYKARMSEIHHADSSAHIDWVLDRIREYVDAKYCFAYRLSDAQMIAAKIRKKNGWTVPSFSDRMTGDAA
jgi:hypothetical protein